jgi:hypothetical protein
MIVVFGESGLGYVVAQKIPARLKTLPRSGRTVRYLNKTPVCVDHTKQKVWHGQFHTMQLIILNRNKLLVFSVWFYVLVTVTFANVGCLCLLHLSP